MSLFRARQWWRTRLGVEEEFPHGSLVVANIDNAEDGMPKIVTGSLQGVLRIHQPNTQQEGLEDDHNQLLEQEFDFPILQLEYGRFISLDSPEVGLAVLHPRRLCVYSVKPAPGGGRALELAYKHDFGRHFTAFNMCSGPFGGCKHDCILVQSMDGRLEIFEQNSHAFSQRFADVVMPGPITYIPKLDVFVTGTAATEIECYRYQSLTRTSQPSYDESTPSDRSTNKGAQRDWSRKLGEGILDIRIGRVSENLRDHLVEIVVICEHSLFVLKEGGGIRLQKRFDQEHPCSLCLYSRERSTLSGPTRTSCFDHRFYTTMQNMLVTTFEDQLKVYNGGTLIWSAMMDSIVVGLAVGQFGEDSGLVVALTDDGILTINYLGTDPPTTAVVEQTTSDVDYNEVDEEHRKLLQVIRESQAKGNQDAWERLELRVTCPRILDREELSPEERNDAQEFMEECGQFAMGRDGQSFVRVTARLFVKHVGKHELKNVQISVSPPEFVALRQKHITLESVKGGSATPLVIPLVFYTSTDRLPSQLTTFITALYTSSTGQPRTAQANFELPLAIACTLTQPNQGSKHGNFKLTIDTNRPPCLLSPLFEDIFAQFTSDEEASAVTGSAANSVLCFQYHFQPPPPSLPHTLEPQIQDDIIRPDPLTATILVSKNTGRYRIQSASLPAIWLVFSQLVRRLENWFKTMDEPSEMEPFKISYNDDLPFQDFFAVIEHHFDSRGYLIEVNSKLNELSHQYRVLEKRLLGRFKEKTPVPLQAIDQLLSQTYNRIIEMGYRVEDAQAQLHRASNALSCTTNLIISLIKFRFGLSDMDEGILATYLSPIVMDSDDQGWEEQVDSALALLLKNRLGKNTKDFSTGQVLTMPKNTTKLRKHISDVCARLSKGYSLGESTPPSSSAEEKV